MLLFLLSFNYYHDSLKVEHYRLIYANSFEEACDKLERSLTKEYHNVTNRTIN